MRLGMHLAVQSGPVEPEIPGPGSNQSAFPKHVTEEVSLLLQLTAIGGVPEPRRGPLVPERGRRICAAMACALGQIGAV